MLVTVSGCRSVLNKKVSKNYNVQVSSFPIHNSDYSLIQRPNVSWNVAIVYSIQERIVLSVWYMNTIGINLNHKLALTVTLSTVFKMQQL